MTFAGMQVRKSYLLFAVDVLMAQSTCKSPLFKLVHSSDSL